MSLINLSVKHGRSLEEARGQLGQAVEDVRKAFGALVQRVDWSADRTKVTLGGVGFEVLTPLRLDDGGALVFVTPPLGSELSVLGAPVLHLKVAADAPVAQLSVRISDVAPDDRVTRVSYQVLNAGGLQASDVIVPEPAGLALLGLAGAALLKRRRAA